VPPHDREAFFLRDGSWPRLRPPDDIDERTESMQSFRPVIRWWSFVKMRLVAHFSEVLEVHPDRLVFRRGLLSKSESVLPFSRITNYSADQNVLDRIFGAADYRVETAGSNITPELILTGYSAELRNIFARALNRSAS